MGTFTTEKIGPVAILRFDNPPHNYMTSKMVRELDVVTREWELDPNIRVIVLTSAVEGSFLTHYDIKDILEAFKSFQKTPKAFLGLSIKVALFTGRCLRFLERFPSISRRVENSLSKGDMAGVVDLERIHRVFNRLQRMGKVVIAAINGDAMGGATELCMACDLRIMADGDYWMGLPEVTVSIIPGAGGTQRMTRLLGYGKALELMLDGKTLTPGEALDVGLIHRVVEPQNLMDEVMETAARLAKRPPVSVRGIKEAVRLGAEMEFEKGLEFEKKWMYSTTALNDTVKIFEHYLKEMENGRDELDLIKSLQKGGVVGFEGR
jgi:enoyl-CoA hydratase